MAVRVKVPRLALIARLEAVRDQMKADHQKALKKYADEKLKARARAAKELHKAADRLGHDADLYLASNTHTQYRGEHERRFNVLIVEAPGVIPKRPEPHRALSSVERAIALIDASEDDKVSISTDDMLVYGIGNLAGLLDD